MMLHFFSSKYIVAALAMMAMTMTYNINNSNGVVNAEYACKVAPDLEVCTSGSCTCGEYDCPADHICGNCEDDENPCSSGDGDDVASGDVASGDVASGDVASGDVGGASAECYSCTFTGKLCAVPFTECTGPSTPCDESYTGTLSSNQCTATAAEASGDVSGDGDDDDDNDGASADAETNVVAGAEASAQAAEEDGEAAMNEGNMDSTNDTEAAAEAGASTTAAAAEAAGSTTAAAAEAAGSTTAAAAEASGTNTVATTEAAAQATAEENTDSVSDASTTATEAATAAQATANEAVNNVVKVEVSSAALLSSSMIGIAAVTTAFVAIA